MAGNQRAASLALMAAEFGASDFSYAVGPDLELDVREPNEGETYDDYMSVILAAFQEWASGNDVDTPNSFMGNCFSQSVEVASQGVSTLSNSCYAVSARGLGGSADLVSVDVDGLVYSGSLSGFSHSSGALSTLPDNLVARRTVRLLVGVLLGESLSPLNFVGELGYFNGIDSQATLEGEEIDGYVNPAISVSSKDEAEKIVQDIIGKTKNISDYAYFVPDDPALPCAATGAECAADVPGVYHALDVVNFSASPPAYEGDYDNCTTTNNSLCNYKGGIASVLGAPILTKPSEFDAFVNAAVEGVVDKPTYWMTGAEAAVFGTEGQEDVYFVTNQDDAAGYTRPVWDDYLIRDSDVDGEFPPRMERPLMDLGGFDKSGVLIVDGDVEFDGNPEFEGLIIVLGDYNINGSGNEPFTGAIISAPYSTHYTDGTNELVPFRDSNGYFLDSSEAQILDGNGNPIGPGARVVTTNEQIPDTNPPVYKSYIVDAGGGMTNLEPVYVQAGCLPGSNCTKYTQGSFTDDNVNRKFDPLGVKVNGGGKQPYIYDYQVLMNAFSLLSEEAKLLFLVGQSRPNGTYEYGIKGWGEVVVPPDV